MSAVKSRDQALADAGRVLAEDVAVSSRLSPMEAAQRAWHPGGPSVEDLAAQIAANRATAAVQVAA